MSAIPVIVILSCLFILGSSRPRVAVRVVAVQGFFLGLLPLLRAGKDLSAGILILGLSGMAVKGLLLPLLMSAVLRRTGIQRESDPPVGYGASLVIGVLLLGLAAWLAVSIGFPPQTSLPLTVTAFFLIMVGLFLLIGRRLAIMQSLAYLVLENGVYALGVSISLELPLAVELGIMLDVFVAVFLMGNLLFHLDREFQPAEAVQSSEQSGIEEEA